MQYLYFVLAGLGKDEQGLSTCLQVEKTSRRGGKIINKDIEVSQPGISYIFHCIHYILAYLLISSSMHYRESVSAPF